MNLRRSNTFFALVALATVFTLQSTIVGQEVAATLPRPDQKPGNSSKPVQVYILAGQSNMVGMGNLSGATNSYNGIYYGSDPDLPNGPFQVYRVGTYKIATIEVCDSQGSRTNEPIADGTIEIPENGIYKFQCGFEDSSYCEMRINDKRVYRRVKDQLPEKEEIALKAGQKYPFKIVGHAQTPPRFWMKKTDLLGYGDLEAVVKRDGKFPWLLDEKGEWSVRQDVYFQEARLAKEGKGSLLSATSNGKSIGPELGFGHIMGTYHDEQVLIIKTAQGNRSLGFDFRPPSSGRTAPDNDFEAAEYRLMIEGVRKTLDNIDKVVPGYKGQGYNIAGFAWFQGHKDSFSETQINNYEKNLVNLIKDVRAEFKKPNLPVVVATVGFGGHNMQEKFQRILRAQLAVGDPKQNPDLAGTVASVDTRDFWREVDESPANQDYHYNRNAETYLLIGDSLGRAMVRLLGGTAEPLPVTKRPQSTKSPKATSDSAQEIAKAQKAMRPIIMDGIASSYIQNPRYEKSIKQEALGEKPQRSNQFLRGAIYGLINCYRAAGITDYDWKPFGPDLDKIQWDYFSFDPPEKLAIEKGNRFRKVTYPEGMSNWASKDFDAKRAGWKQGLQPFGQLDGKLDRLSEICNAPFCRCGEVPKKLWEKEVLLVRGTFQLPPLKENHRYRIVIGGAAHVNSGEGFSLYVNGKLLGESPTGVAVRQGGQPRGAHVYSEFLDEFKGGEITIAATSFLRFNHPRKGVQPPRGHLSLKIEEQKIPPIVYTVQKQASN